MGTELLHLPGRTISRVMGICLVFTILWALPQSASAETPVLLISGNDLAPHTIYLGELYTQDMINITMLHLDLTTTYEDGITCNSITLFRSGRSADSNVANVHVYEDVDRNQSLNLGTDILISSGNFELARAELSINRIITSNAPLSILFVLDISPEIDSDGTIGFSIPDESYVNCQAGVIVEFEHPLASKNSSLLIDTDGDLNPDSTDSDDDNDGYTDAIEKQVGYDTKDPNSVPPDHDSDFVPDSIDTDDDNDGVPDKYDDFPMDKTRQRDYIVVIIYALIAIIIIVAMIVVTAKKRAMFPGIESEIDYESDDEFDIDRHELGKDLDDKILDEDESELLD